MENVIPFVTEQKKLATYKEYFRVLSTLAKHGPGIPLNYLFDKEKYPIAIRRLTEELGPVYVKISQCLSTRSELFSPEVLQEISKLRDNVKPENQDLMKKALEKNFKDDAKHIFERFDWHPIGCGSVSHVYSATLRTGEKVAVKIVRPNIHNKLTNNFSLIKNVISVLERLNSNFRTLRLVSIIEELEELLLTQTNLSTELNNMIKFDKLLSKSSFRHLGKNTIVVPKVYEELSSDEVLVMEYIDGIEPYDFDQLDIEPSKLVHVVDILLDQMIFFSGTMHADLHPGNFFWNKEGKIVLIDFGLICELEEEQREHLSTAYTAIVDGYIDFSTNYLLKHFIVAHDGAVISEKSFGIAYKELNHILRQHFVVSQGKPRFGVMFAEVLKCLSKLNLGIISKYSKAFLTLITIDGYMYQLDPNFDMLENMRRKLLAIVEYNAVPVATEKLILGEKGTYSTALFEGTTDPQVAYDNIQNHIINSLNLNESCTLIDVGCGRGQLLSKVQASGIDCFGITLSKFEYDVCVQNGIECVHSSWESFDASSPSYRKVHAMTVIEMFLHLSSLHENKVGLGTLRIERFFNWAHEILEENGCIYLQDLIIDDRVLHDPEYRQMYNKINKALPFVGFTTLNQIQNGIDGLFDITEASDSSLDLLPTYRFWKEGVLTHENTLRQQVNADVFSFLSTGIDALLELSEKGLLRLYRCKLQRITTPSV